MIKSRGIVSFALAAGIVMTMFSSVFATPAWDVTGHWNPGAGETEFDWRSKPGEMEVDLSPTTPQYTTDPSDYFYKDAYGKMNQYSQKTVTFDYKGTVAKPNLIFRAPLVGGNGDYIYNFGSKMAGTMNIYNAKVMEMRINTTNALNLIFHDYDDDEYFPTINSNNKSSDLSVSLMGTTKQNVTVGSGYKGIDYSIKDSTTLKSVTVSESITTVPDNAFYNDTALCAVSLPSTITSIEYSAFYHDTALKTLGIPKSVKSIKPDAFEKSGITTINYNGTMADWGKIDIYETHLDRFDNPYISFDGLLTEHAITVKCTDGNIVLPARSRNTNSYTGVSGYVAQTGGKPGFAWEINGGSMKVIVGADSSKYCYTSMDEFFDNLPVDGQTLIITREKDYTGEVIFAPEITRKTNNNIKVSVSKNYNGEIVLDFLKKVKSIQTFSNDTVTIRMKNVDRNTLPDIPQNETNNLYLEFGKFTGSTITFPACYDEVSVAFNNKDKIETAVFDSSIKTIKSPALKDSKNLKEVFLPSSVTRIEYEAFSNCDKLKKIDMPSSVNCLFDTTFSGNAEFTDIYYDGYKADWEQIGIDSITAVTKPYTLLFEKGVVIHCKDGDIGEHDPEEVTPPTGGPTQTPSTPAPSTPAPSTPAPSNPSTTGGGFEEFVERLYTVALNRASEPEGKAFWCEHVGNGDLNGAQCANEFLLSKEFNDRGLSDEEFLKVLYKTFFDRDAANDPDGFNFWMNSLKTEGRDKVVDGFINSTEWCNICASYGVKSGATRAKATIASKNATAFATRLYTECLGRDPEEGGLKFWSLGLTNLELTGKQAAHEFFFSKEFNDFNLDNKGLLTRMYKTFMGREPDDDGMNYWLKEMSNGMTKEQVFDNFVNSAEFTQICKDYAIDRG
ncbi:MAG: DUF4214 domain-containing protein [Clostridia bacterium]|nr:DUF4214 domain-containing protein [Clostridia bacterium]